MMTERIDLALAVRSSVPFGVILLGPELPRISSRLQELVTILFRLRPHGYASAIANPWIYFLRFFLAFLSGVIFFLFSLYPSGRANIPYALLLSLIAVAIPFAYLIVKANDQSPVASMSKLWEYSVDYAKEDYIIFVFPSVLACGITLCMVHALHSLVNLGFEPTGILIALLLAQVLVSIRITPYVGPSLCGVILFILLTGPTALMFVMASLYRLIPYSLRPYRDSRLDYWLGYGGAWLLVGMVDLSRLPPSIADKALFLARVACYHSAFIASLALGCIGVISYEAILSKM